MGEDEKRWGRDGVEIENRLERDGRATRESGRNGERLERDRIKMEKR
jgi:hypothetical protein